MKTNNNNSSNNSEKSLFLQSFRPAGNQKLLDYCDPETGVIYKYAQFNTVPGLNCPFASLGCSLACYAKSGRHMFKNVVESRKKAYFDTLRPDFSKAIIYTIEKHLAGRRYNGATMIIRLHEAGDFYSLDYLKKWVKVFKHFQDCKNIVFCFYTKSFPFFIELSPAEKSTLKKCMSAGTVAASLSLDDTTSPAQLERAAKLRKIYPLFNVYYCTDNLNAINFDAVCDCKNCAKCGLCTHATGKITACKIHSVSNKQLQQYQAKKRK